MRLYDLKAGMNPRRVRIFLAEKEIEVPTTAVDMMKGENRTPEFLNLNPLGTLPVLELDDGTILTESVAICRYFEFLQPEPNLFGRDGVEQARVEMWNRRVELELMRPVAEQFRHLSPFWEGRLAQIPEYGELQRTASGRIMEWLDRELRDAPLHRGRSLHDRGYHRPVRAASRQEHRRSGPRRTDPSQTLVGGRVSPPHGARLTSLCSNRSGVARRRRIGGVSNAA